MVQERTTARVVEGMRGNTEVLYDVLRDGNDRMYRMNRIVLDEAQRTQDENMDLIRQWLQAPMQIGVLNREVFDTLGRRNRRRLELVRTLADDLRDFGTATRSIWERVSENNRQTTQGTAQGSRELATAAAREAANAVGEVSNTVDDAARSLRRQTKRAEDSVNGKS